MRIGRRSLAMLAVATAGALAVAGIAMAAGSSTATFKFTPDRVPKNTYEKGKLFVHTHTSYTGGTKTDRAQLYFDDDIKISARGIPRCSRSDISGTKTLAQAMAACGSAKVGSGKAQAAAGANTVNACVLAFNGVPSRRRPTILLFTRANASPPFTIDCSSPTTNTAGNTNVLLAGVLKGTSGDFGKQLVIRNIVAASPLPLTDFRVTVKRGRYVSARCHDVNKRWNLKTKFTYVSPASSETVRDSQECRRS